MKAQPALFEGEGKPKNEAVLFQSTVDIHFQNAHKTVKGRTLCIYHNQIEDWLMDDLSSCHPA